MKEKIIFDKSQHKIAIIAPSHGCLGAKEKLLQAQKLFEEKGFECVWDENILSGHEKLDYLASSEEQRIQELKSAILDHSIRIIWLFRGGSDAQEIALECLEIKPAENKILIGFSDVTCLHSLFNNFFKLPSIHGSVITTILGDQKEMLDPIINVLSGGKTELKLEAFNEKAKNAKIEGKITGGNLSVISSALIGTDLQPDMDNKIIFLEDVGELPYAVNRALNHLKNAKLFSKVKAVVFADFTYSKSAKSEENLQIVNNINITLKEFAEKTLGEIPFFRCEGIGHGKLNYPIVMMGEAVIKDDILTIESPFELI